MGRREPGWRLGASQCFADGVRARGGLGAVWPCEGSESRDHVRWEHRNTHFGEAAAPRGVDSAQRSVVTGYGVGGRGSVRAASDGGRVESRD